MTGLRAFTFAVAVGIASWAAPGIAQETPAPPQGAASTPLADSLTGEAKAEYEAARLLFGDGDFSGAAAKFKRAHELSADPRLLWNMAVCEKELRHYGVASALVDRYLAEGGERITAENRANAIETRDALRGFFSHLTLSGVPAGARVLIDGELRGTAPLSGPLVVDLGARKLRVEHAGHEPYERVLDVPGSSEMSLAVSLRPQKVAARLTVTTASDGVIRIDGKTLGSGRWEGELAPGEHVVEVSAPGRKLYRYRLELTARQTRSLDVLLVKENERTVWPWIAGGAAVVAGAAVGGYFLFRRDERGTVPEGELATVYLPGVLR